MAHFRTYCPSVRVGNWNEDIQLEEDTLKDFLTRRANGQLLIQKSSGMVSKMSNPIQLSTTSDGTIRFGDTVMVVNRGNQDRTAYSVSQSPRDDSALAIHLKDGANSDPTNPAPLAVTGAKQMKPSFRTSFKIIPERLVLGCANFNPHLLLEPKGRGSKAAGPITNQSIPISIIWSKEVNFLFSRKTKLLRGDEFARIGDKLRYGQPFMLITASPDAGNRYLYSDVALFSRCSEKSRHQIIQLVLDSSFATTWQAEHKNPMIRLEYEHEPVLANEECIIQHCKTHQNLCVEENHIVPTHFGYEYEISAHTNLDSHKADMPVNRWMLVMGVAGDNSYPVNLNIAGDQSAAELIPSV